MPSMPAMFWYADQVFRPVSGYPRLLCVYRFLAIIWSISWLVWWHCSQQTFPLAWAVVGEAAVESEAFFPLFECTCAVVAPWTLEDVPVATALPVCATAAPSGVAPALLCAAARRMRLAKLPALA